MVAEADDALMEKFFETGTLTQDELVVGLKRAVAAGRVFPLCARPAPTNIGMQPLLDAILTYAPSPAERPFAATAKASEDVIAVTASTAGRLRCSCGRPSPIRSPDGSRCSASSPAWSRRIRPCRT